MTTYQITVFLKKEISVTITDDQAEKLINCGCDEWDELSSDEKEELLIQHGINVAYQTKNLIVTVDYD